MTDTRDEKRVESLLRPLTLIEPVSLSTRRRTRPARWRLGVIAAATALVVAGVAVAATSLGWLDRATLIPKVVADDDATRGVPQSECHLLGQPAAKAIAFFDARGVAIEWRLTRFATSREERPGAVATSEGFTSAPAHVPPDSVVWDIRREPQLGPRRVLVFVHLFDDANAPRVAVPASCRE